jgi:hypothetical protein
MGVYKAKGTSEDITTRSHQKLKALHLLCNKGVDEIIRESRGYITITNERFRKLKERVARLYGT